MDLTLLETWELAPMHTASWTQRSQGISSLTLPCPRTPGTVGELLAGFPLKEPPLASGSEEKVNLRCLPWGSRPLTL